MATEITSVLNYLTDKKKELNIENFAKAVNKEFINEEKSLLETEFGDFDVRLTYDDKDIEFIKNNFSEINESMAEKLLGEYTSPELGTGLWRTLIKKIDGWVSYEILWEEGKFTKKNMQVLILLLGKTKEDFITSELNLREEVLSYIVMKQQATLLNILALQEYSFDNFDKKALQDLKGFLETYNGDIDGLYKAYKYKTDPFGNFDWYWEDGKNNKISGECNVGKAIYQQLFFRKSNFKKPFGDQEFKPDLQHDKITSLPIKNLSLDDSPTFLERWEKAYTRGWFPKEQPLIYFVYSEFLLDLISEANSVTQTNGEIKFNSKKVKNSFDDAITKLLNTKIESEVGYRDYEEGLGVYSEGFTATSHEYKKYVAKLFLDDFRKKTWANFSNQFAALNCKEIKDLGKNLEGKKRAFEKAEGDTVLPVLGVPDEEEAEVLSDEDIEAKQKFLKQCMLMTRLDELANENLKDTCKQVIEGGGKIHKKHKPYSNRFYMVQDDPNGDQSAMVNKLIIPPGDAIREFLDMRPSTHAYLIPKLRFYKVYTDKEGKISEFRFHFANFTDPNRVEKLSNSNFDRGGDYGVKSFDFSFEGATPATAKNDIKANLSLYFQSFGDFVDRKFSSGDGEKHAFVDLLLLPSGKQKAGSGSPSIFQFAAKYYRIRVDVGWEIASSKISDLNEAIGTKAAAKLTESLKKMNKSFLLNMIDHTMEFKDDGSIQIDVEYRAYIESALKGTTMDALASKEARKALAVIRKDYEKVVSANRCSAEELNEIRLQLEQIEDLFVKQSYQSIMKRLIENGSIKFKKANDSSSKQFLSRGILTTKVEFINIDSITGSETTLTQASETGTFLNSDAGFVDLKSKDDYLYINYFYLGDLLYAITDCMYDDNGRLMEGLEKFKFVLGSFDYEDLLENNNPKKTINLANIPISCELFYEWFTQNVIKPERNSYPIMYFIRDLCKFLIVEILSENCFKRSLDKSLQFKTMNFLGKKTGRGDPLGSLYVYRKNKPENLVLNLSKHYGTSLPLSVDDEDIVSVRDVYNYMTIYVETPRLKSKKDRTTTKRQDEAEGIMHYQIGRDRGILKKIKFAKSDMQYIREARFFRHGNDGLMQLSAVYKVTMEMVGNTLYYPGMEIFIDPLGLLGADLQADPRERNSIANRLGFGGYHLITNVKSSIGPGKFTTTVDALFSYSGDGDPSSRVVGTTDQIKKSKEKNISEKADNRSAASKKFCADVYDHVITEAILIDDGADKYNPIDIQSVEDTSGITATANLISQGATQEQINILIASDNDIELKDLTYDKEDETFIEILSGGDFTEFKIEDGKVIII